MLTQQERCKVHPSSFRDPSGFLFLQAGSLYRQVNLCYQRQYEHLMRSGLYQNLVGQGALVRHEEVASTTASFEGCYKILRPAPVPFVSYPYEWCFSQLKAAALLTLKVQRAALKFGMSLKDASAYNIQFHHTQPVLIDTLSFDLYEAGEPWDAYRQFCQHFLGPLALMATREIRLQQLLRIHLDGIPLDLTSALLARRTYLKPSLLAHIHLHAKAQRHFAQGRFEQKRHPISLKGLLGFLEYLERCVQSLRWRPQRTEWSDYYARTNYGPNAAAKKKQLVSEFLDSATPPLRHCWDLGANDGSLSRLTSERGILTVSMDSDPSCVERNYLEASRNGHTQLLPLLVDLTNPSPSAGWSNQERLSLLERGPVDLILCLALVHHWAIGNNLPLTRIADFLSSLCSGLMIEFVPKTDSQAQRLLASREDIFSGYTQQHFEKTFERHFVIQRKVLIEGTERTLYLMRKR